MKLKWLREISVILLIVVFVPTPSKAADAVTARVEVREWDVPAPNSRPHDPAIAPDGSLWYTGMRSNTLGRLDPKTGEIREYRVKLPDSGPHGLTADREGNIWFTANYKDYIGKLDPKLDPGTGGITEYPMPDKAARGPHTPVFDQKGILWFTVEEGNFVGRLDPRTGAIKLIRSPTPDSVPYGIAVNSKGVPFFCEFGTNKFGSVDPATLEITEYKLPEGSRPRRLAITSDDKVYFTDYARGRLGLFDPKTGETKEWPSPGGPGSRPYGIAITPDGEVWYSESGVSPNTIVRFDPATQAFAAWPIPSGGGVVRNMVSTPEGNLYIACSGVNKIGIVRIGR